ncbi:MAG TPA: hypothetical protein VF530_11375 [Planctomycetota bacterium]
MVTKSWVRSLSIFLALAPLFSGEDRGPARSPGSDPTFHCAGEIRPPLEVRLLTPLEELQPGASLELRGEVVFQQDAPSARLRFEALDAASLGGAALLELGARAAGEVVPFTLPVAFGWLERGAVHALVEVSDDQGALLHSARAEAYALFRPAGVLAGRGGYLALEQQAVEEDIRTGRIPPEAAAGARAAASRIEATDTGARMRRRAYTLDEQRLNSLVGAPPMGYRPASLLPLVGGANITIQGTVSWTDENGSTHPVWGANVDIWDDDTLGDEYLTTVVTDLSGNYQAVVNNDDGVGQGDRDIYVDVRAENSWVRTETTGDSLYVITSGVFDETPGGSVLDFSPTAANTGTGPAMSIFQSATWIAGYVAFDAEGAAFPMVNIVWPNGDDGSFYDGEVQIEQEDRWDWDTVHHEYGHYAMDRLNIENNPGGPHNIGDCIAMVRGSKDEGNRLAWGEGWPTYFGTSAQAEMNMAALGVPRVGDVSYQDLEDGNLQYSLESQDNNGRGEDNEVAVQRLLWDLYDSSSDGRDEISRSDNSIWNAVAAAAASPHILHTYWQGLLGGQSSLNLLRMGEIASDHLIGPRLVSPPEGAIVSPASNFLDWQADVGCPSSYSGDQFDLVFFDAMTLAPVLTIPGLTSSSHSLTNTQIATIVASTHDVLWGVRGYETASPATGPYLGETFAAIVNRPPVADAGSDQPAVECTSHTTTSVQLDGTASSDPDGDSLTYSWSSPGVVFDDPLSATPIGQFPKGTKVVTLTVSDGIEQDQDTVSITVVDTTPPVLSVPAPITLECNGHCGVEADDPQLLAWFAQASATDACDPSPLLSDDSPSCFPLGTTPVTFTATDDDMNMSQSSVDVTVEDTTPPEITVELDRTVLWPPNHKLARILASVVVTDVCDPAPTFVLTSITSDEPDDGLGDGDRPDDIQGAAYGMADVEFHLRSERQGGGDGRVYTIVYTASDMSGNTAQAEVTVTVPHDGEAAAFTVAGLQRGSRDFEPGAKDFTLAVLGSVDLDVRSIRAGATRVGNHLGLARPSKVWLQDLNGDRVPDLAFSFDVATARALTAGGRIALGFRYETREGTGHCAADVFLLPTLGSGETPSIAGQ